MQIRPAADSDLPAIARVQARTMVAAAHYEDSVDEEAVYRRLHPRVSGYFAGTYAPKFALPQRVMFVAEEQGQVVGFIAGHCSTRRGCNAELQWLFVLPHWQRRGVGGQLLQPLREWFIAQGSTRVIIDAPPTNPCRAFYLKHGAIPLDEHWLYWEDIGRTQASA
jgi:GNAT superfamily N-acetyltransferase